MTSSSYTFRAGSGVAGTRSTGVDSTGSIAAVTGASIEVLDGVYVGAGAAVG